MKTYRDKNYVLGKNAFTSYSLKIIYEYKSNIIIIIYL